MAAKDNLNNYQFRYRPTGDQMTHPEYWEDDEVDALHEGFPNFNHEVQAYYKPTKKVVGRVLYSAEGPIYQVDVHTEHQGKGVATGMVKHGQRIAKASKYRIPLIQRAENETEEGEAWASKLQERGIL